MCKEIINQELETKLIYEPMPGKIKGAVIICAGGGYEWLSPREEWPVAHTFEREGYQPYILKYTTGSVHAPLRMKPLMQIAWAVATVRKVTDEKIIICGFSAGGHLCSMLGNLYNDISIFSEEMRQFSRPDALILGYPVTSIRAPEFSDLRHLLIEESENQLYFNPIETISSSTPPTFIWHTVTDEIVPVYQSIEYSKKLIEKGVFTELHLYSNGVHGLSVATPDVDEPNKNRYSDPAVAAWLLAAVNWLQKID